MKIVVFESEPREAPAFDWLKRDHDVTFVEGPLRAASAGNYGDAEVISTIIYSKLDRDALDQLSALRLRQVTVWSSAGAEQSRLRPRSARRAMRLQGRRAKLAELSGVKADIRHGVPTWLGGEGMRRTGGRWNLPGMAGTCLNGCSLARLTERARWFAIYMSKQGSESTARRNVIGKKNSVLNQLLCERVQVLWRFRG